MVTRHTQYTHKSVEMTLDLLILIKHLETTDDLDTSMDMVVTYSISPCYKSEAQHIEHLPSSNTETEWHASFWNS